MVYQPPIHDILFTLNHIADFGRMLAAGAFEDLDAETAAAIVEEAGRFAVGALVPLDRSGDETGARLQDGAVILPPGWREAYARWREAGWAGLPCPKDHGGQGLPCALSAAVAEIWASANLAFSLAPMLTQGAVEALAQHGSPALKALYLPKMISGEWAGSMQLTEPQAGSDMRFLGARAVPQADGTFRITGTKIFITFGEHALAENIVHLVLARLPDAPPGLKGISLFLAPKFLPNADGSPGLRNDIVCTKIENKLGLHGSPTCVMIHGSAPLGSAPLGGATDGGGSTAWLVGEPHRGLHAMFTMMNRARLGVGVQGVGVAERAFQGALAYARERRQGRAPGAAEGETSPIIRHPDIQRLLLTMKAKIAAARAICHVCASAMDESPRNGEAAALAALLTPVAKAFASDVGMETASDALQVFGGMGYIEEAGAAQRYRDARIGPIYEGTNGIQAIDLLTHKLPSGGGEPLRALIRGLKNNAGAIRAAQVPDGEAAFATLAGRLDAAIAALEETSLWMGEALATNRAAALAGATPYLRLFALTLGGSLLAKGALASIEAGEDPATRRGRVLLARHFAAHLLPETQALRAVVTSGSETTLDAEHAL